MLLIASGGRIWAQGNLSIGQYPDQQAYYNPAAIAQTHDLKLTVAHQRTYEGIDGAPKSFLLLGDMPLKMMYGAHGLGVQLSNESVGLFTDTELAVRYALGFKVRGGILRIGVGVHMLTSRFDGTKVYIPTGIDGVSAADPSIPTTEVSGRGFDLAFGGYYTTSTYWLGVSVGHIFAPTILMGERYQRIYTRSYILMGGYNYRASNSLYKWMPSFLAHINEQGLYRVEGRMGMWYRDRFHVAPFYRLFSGVGVGVGVRLGKLYLGYQYEYPTSKLRSTSWGSHELMMSYSMPIDMARDRQIKYKSIRVL